MPLDVEDLNSHVDAFDGYGNKFVILLAMKEIFDYDKFLGNFEAYVEVIRGFVTAWNQGEPVSNLNTICPTP